MFKGRHGGLETFFFKTGFSLHIWYQLKGLDELSWKIAKKIFFDPRRPSLKPRWPLKWVKIGLVLPNFSGKSVNEILFLLWIFLVKRFFRAWQRVFFQFQSSIFVAGAYPYRCQLVMIFSYNFTFEVFFFTCYIKKLGKSSLSRSAKFCCDRFGISFMSVS